MMEDADRNGGVEFAEGIRPEITDVAEQEFAISGVPSIRKSNVPVVGVDTDVLDLGEVSGEITVSAANIEDPLSWAWLHVLGRHSGHGAITPGCDLESPVPDGRAKNWFQ